MNRELQTLNNASKIERDAAKRRIYGLANVIKSARAWPHKSSYPSHHYRMAEWLLLRASSAELRALADALDLQDTDITDISVRRRKIVEAYMEALEESDPQFRWRNLFELGMPGKRYCVVSPVGLQDIIKSPPTWRQFKVAFVRLFGARCLPKEFSVRKTITRFYGLPLAKSKPGRPRK